MSGVFFRVWQFLVGPLTAVLFKLLVTSWFFAIWPSPLDTLKKFLHNFVSLLGATALATPPAQHGVFGLGG